MPDIKFKDQTILTSGSAPQVGETAPDFKLVKTDLTDVSLKNFTGKNIILNIVPSIDTGTCAKSAKAFDDLIQKIDNAVVLVVSMDLPFAHKRFCSQNNLNTIIPLSDFRHNSIGKNYGLRITNTAMAGLFARTVIVIDKNNKVTYIEQVADISKEPNYDAVLNLLKNQAKS